MGMIGDLFGSIWRDYVTDGVAGSGPYKPPKIDIRSLGQTLDALIAGGIRPADILYQDFADVEDGTLVDGLELATGQTLSLTGPGAADAEVQDGKIEFSDNCYMVADFPHKNLVVGFRVSWPTATDGKGVTLAAGDYIDGNIITRMVHGEFQYQENGYLTLWDDDFTPNPKTEAELGESYKLTIANGYNGLVGVNAETQIEMVIAGDIVTFLIDGVRLVRKYYHAEIQRLIGEYVYWQSGTAAPSLAYIHAIWARPLTAAELLTFAPTPHPRNVEAAHSFSMLKQIVKNAATECFKLTPPGGTFAQQLKITLGVQTHPVPGYAVEYTEWSLQVGNYDAVGGPNVLSAPLALVTRAGSVNAGVLAIAAAVTAAVSGDEIRVSVNPTVSGSNAAAVTHAEIHLRVDVLSPYYPSVPIMEF